MAINFKFDVEKDIKLQSGEQGKVLYREERQVEGEPKAFYLIRYSDADGHGEHTEWVAEEALTA